MKSLRLSIAQLRFLEDCLVKPKEAPSSRGPRAKSKLSAWVRTAKSLHDLRFVEFAQAGEIHRATITLCGIQALRHGYDRALQAFVTRGEALRKSLTNPLLDESVRLGALSLIPKNDHAEVRAKVTEIIKRLDELIAVKQKNPAS